MTRYNNKAVKLKKELLKASLESWAMKPLVATAGMKEGILNEIQVLKALPQFFQANQASNITADQSIHSCERESHTVEYIRSVGLLGS